MTRGFDPEDQRHWAEPRPYPFDDDPPPRLPRRHQRKHREPAGFDLDSLSSEQRLVVLRLRSAAAAGPAKADQTSRNRVRNQRHENSKYVRRTRDLIILLCYQIGIEAPLIGRVFGLSENGVRRIVEQEKKGAEPEGGTG